MVQIHWTHVRPVHPPEGNPDLVRFSEASIVITVNEYKKLHSLQSLVRTTRRTKTANITKMMLLLYHIDIAKVTVLQT